MAFAPYNDPLSTSYLLQDSAIPLTHIIQLNNSNSLEAVKRNLTFLQIFLKKCVQSHSGCHLQTTIFICFARAPSSSAPVSRAAG